VSEISVFWEGGGGRGNERGRETGKEGGDGEGARGKKGRDQEKGRKKKREMSDFVVHCFVMRIQC